MAKRDTPASRDAWIAARNHGSQQTRGQAITQGNPLFAQELQRAAHEDRRERARREN